MSPANLPTVPEKFIGWIAKDKDAVGNLTEGEYEPKPFTDDDVDIAITHCGICGSDLHILRCGWGTTQYPQVVGHEIAGIAVRVGASVKHIKVGDRVGVGAQSGSCQRCDDCDAHREPYCTGGLTETYNSKYPDGSKSYGGYADFSRVPGHFVIPIPDGISSSLAASMMCAGVTMYSPLKQYGAGTQRKNVGIVGIGGLGHFGLMLAKAMGANVTAISHSDSKKADAEALGATKFVATHGDDPSVKENAGTLDLIIVTTNDARMPVDTYLSLLKQHGYIVFVGIPEALMPPIPLVTLIFRNLHIAGSLVGSPNDIREMLEVAAKHQVKGWVKEWPLTEVNEALIGMQDGKPRYRYVLVNEKHKELARD